MSETLTIAEIAKRLDLPESTVRYYRDRFLPFIPTVGEGRRKRYRIEALEVIRLISQGLRSNRSAIDIENELSARFPRNVEASVSASLMLEASSEKLSPIAGISLDAVHSQAIQRLTSVLDNIVDRIEQLEAQEQNASELRISFEKLQERQAEETEEWAERLEEHDRKLLNQVRAMMSSRQQEALQPWWRRWLGHAQSS